MAAKSLGILALAGALLVVVTPAYGQGVVRSAHGDWQIRCDTPPGAQSEQCALIQSVTAEDRPNVGLTVIVLKTADESRNKHQSVTLLEAIEEFGFDACIGGARRDEEKAAPASSAACQTAVWPKW